MAQKRRSPEIIAGRVNADGSIAAGDGFTVAKSATGSYTVTFAGGFRAVSVTASPTSGAGAVATTVQQPSERAVGILTVNSSFTLVDGGFLFTAVGVQQ